MMVSVLLRLRPSGLLDEFPKLAAYVARGEARPTYERKLGDELLYWVAVLPGLGGGDISLRGRHFSCARRAGVAPGLVGSLAVAGLASPPGRPDGPRADPAAALRSIASSSGRRWLRWSVIVVHGRC